MRASRGCGGRARTVGDAGGSIAGSGAVVGRDVVRLRVGPLARSESPRRGLDRRLRKLRQLQM